MARPSREAIDTFISITGATEAIALQKLEEHDGDLNSAINAHFGEIDRVVTNQVVSRNEDFVNIDDPRESEHPRSSLPLFPSRDMNRFSLLDPTFGHFPSLFDGRGVSGFPTHGPLVSHPREVRELPIEFKDDAREAGASGVGPTNKDVTRNETAHCQETRGIVIINDEDLDMDHADHGTNASGRTSFDNHIGPTISPVVDMDYNNDIEEEMIRAAIEASKREAERHGLQGHPKSPAQDDTDLARAVSLSLETVEEERAFCEQDGENPSFMEIDNAGSAEAFDTRHGSGSAESGTSSQLKLERKSTLVLEEAEDVEEQPLVRHRSRQIAPVIAERTDSGSPSHSALDPPWLDVDRPQLNGHAFERDEWGGISSQEHDEALMLEAAMFGGIPDERRFQFGYPTRQMPRPPSPTLMAQRLLREQQDDEYLASLQADREKELKAQQEAELRSLEEANAREAALQKKRHEEAETHRKQIEEEELERKLAAKESSLPQEPSSDDTNAVTLLVRMPDGSRRGRRFFKSDKLQFLYDYIDIGKVVKPGSYRLVRPYPRRAFTEGESGLSLSELGLTSKQEALFLELI
ncbi:plant UBX domain-containing protein 8-like isoform X1 [Zingiber officinale]|uniref:plant UBX domain-containing protein 8-like isoform X1 n=1 Tax=Zingiber officinale TaxID=94328 RepID=UPI001C4CC8B5|nr:plant UBX domain-containing protein 8-like isoform X1 [Zingiber officinale]